MKPARGFSLVELTIVIGVVVLLAGLTISTGTAVVRHAEHRMTETAMTQLDAAVREWELHADRKLTWWNGEDDALTHGHADVHSDTRDVLVVTEILDIVTRHAASRDLVARIDDNLVYRYEDDTAPWLANPVAKSQVVDRFVGSLTILDAWGVPIYATHPGRLWAPGDEVPRDDDGTIRTRNESDYGVAPNRRIVFVSAGPDRRFGLPAEFAPQEMAAMYEARRDNIYSVPVVFHHGY